MKSDLKALLNTIGYQRALQLNRSLLFGLHDPNENGGKIFKNKDQANREFKRIREILIGLSKLPSPVRTVLDGSLRTPEDWDMGVSPLARFEDGLLEFAIDAKAEINQHWSGPGASRKFGADETARWIAEIHVLGLGKMPRFGTSHDGSDPNTKYGRVVKRAFEIIPIEAGFSGPSRKAIKYLEANDQARFKSLMAIRNRKGRLPLSMIR